ncbi:PREDICTED: midasin-like [Papilio xuthus]|uniref:Midasin n=2 Tax=Papilio xuthus TaxID=66420 RepID=A0AAJ6Z0S8_PAPXU|nr:PREDICTED: midasin-like [Papilio xuthus]
MSENTIVAIGRIEEETTNSDLVKTCQHVKDALQKKTIEITEAINILSDHILNFEDAKLFRKHLSNSLLALVSARIPLKPVFSSSNYDLCNDSEKTNHLEFCIILSTLCDHPDILQYTLKYFQINTVPPFEVFIHHEDSYNVAPKKRRLLNCRQKISDYRIVNCCYTLLNKLPNEFSTKWDWTNFVTNFSYHENAEIKWMVKECMAILTNMTEIQSKLLTKHLNISDEDCMEINFALKNKDAITIEGNTDNTELSTASVVNIDGIMLPVYDKTNVQSGILVPVTSTVNNLRSLALAVASGKALSLMGPVGSGKTSLVEHLAAITGRKGVAFKKIQLGDQTDSRMLLGSHQCTDVPGEFIWSPGVLTEAVQNGHWLLLEDIDCAALDVASTLSSLLERNTLCVPGYRDALPVTPGFQLFVTQRTVTTNYGFQKKMSNSSTLLQRHLTQINVEPLSRSELAEIVQTLYPSLTTICPRIIEVFMMFSVGSHDTSLQTTETVPNTDKETNLISIRGSRLISTRDLMKWCSRAVIDFKVSSPESALKVLQDALDIFTCSVSSPVHRLELAKKIGTCLGIVETKSEFYMKHYKPHVSLNPTSLEVGRAKVPRIEKSLETINFNDKQEVFSFTRQSACLLERIACCVTSNEPVLLVGETGTGKTSSVQYLAKQTGHKLVVINMNQQSDSADLLGGYKPVDLKFVIRPIKNEFIELFKGFYKVDKNQKFLGHIEMCYETENWIALVTLMKQSHKAAVTRLGKERKENKLKLWLTFGHKLTKLEQQVKAATRLTFAFIEGSLVKAMQEGYWVLLDEINLASAEILECLAGLLEDKNEIVHLLEKGDKVPIKRHPDFTLFACMNPATDVGKKDLPVGLRNRFTEFFVDELTERNDLILLIGDYLYHMNLSRAMLDAIYNFYSTVKKEAKLSLVDGAGNAPHYSLRTLCRALTAAAKAKCGTVARSLYEAFCLSFLTQLDRSSHPKVEALIAKAIIGKRNVVSILNQLIPEPQIEGKKYLLFEGHWIPQGKLEIDIPDGYILTPTVRKNLRDIARIVSLGRLPILLQGDTSVGKTSLITYIAKASGNYCVRINNHEHTDLQEYIGSYATDSSGNLVFKEGVLVEAMRKGYWIILDELNLAPSDVLEALNRVLDDNRELFIPETQRVVKADPNFMLFATQNPPGLYGGRKMLSRAFRNRFVELHFDEIPRKELETILHQRCHVPPTYTKKMIAVMADLQVRRRGSAAVQGKDGFITLRDLFRWGNRYKHASKEILTEEKFYDWDQHIADEGYLILAGKVRQTDERSIIEEVIEKHIKRKVNPDNLFSFHQNTSPVTKSILEIIINNNFNEFSHVVWTFNMRRLAVLIAKAFIFDEPVLLVGETGCGKTTICQVLAALSNRKLFSVNCHMHTESSDFLGGLRPVRQYKNDGRLFEWVDGPLILSMEQGHMFLADEISLADDSVLERLNSLLEPERQLVLAEKGMDDGSDIVVVTAAKNFHFIGTMNPGGDFGKKELSPALRNRFTEIWCDNVTSREDLLKVLEKSVGKGIALGNQEDGTSGIGSSILDFTSWLKNSEVTNKFPFSIRDLLSWVQFINVTVTKGLLDTPEAYVHGACMTFLDCFGTALTGHIDSSTLTLLRKSATNFLMNQIKSFANECSENLNNLLAINSSTLKAECDDKKFGIKPFYIDIGPHVKQSDIEQSFTFTAPTTGSNTLRLLRGLQLNKAILLEGNPGVGKTSLVTALAKSSGHKVVRINLSDQTDITDLFGTDLPAEDGSFVFKEGAFLSALQNGDWILLDELNLAPQPVLEGLNACLDHRGEVYIPELGKTFKVKQETKLFACQNPLKQGGARRGLPISFLNRFTQVYIDTLTKEDLIYIVESQYPVLPKDILHRIVNFNCKIAHEITEIQLWGHRGGPWEMNLRDIQRWCESLIADLNAGNTASPGKFVDMLYVNRMRTVEDKNLMIKAYDDIFCPEYPRSDINPQFNINDEEIIIGDVKLKRNNEKAFKNKHSLETNLLVLRNQMPILKSVAQNVKMNWLTILVGSSSTGKSSVIQILADLTGHDLHVLPVTSAMDVSDLLGGFEQVDYNRNLENIYDAVETLTQSTLRDIWLTEKIEKWKENKLLINLHEYKKLQCNFVQNSSIDDNENFKIKVQFLLKHCHKLLERNLTNDITDKVQLNINKLNNLLRKVQSFSVNTGGKFEWVDSLLVKTLMEGSWLLLDNVNLTSAAVLDRLNGLLEPNGVLSIPERGEISEIKPHPNFRVFFTMDPKYGEISRAMRNRGVELFMLRSADMETSLSESMPYLDLTALLSSCGLSEKYFNVCIKCHELMTMFIQGLDRPTVSHLIQASHLTWQQILRGISSKTALLNSFSDVYIKPRTGSDFVSNINVSLAEMKNNMLKALENEIEKAEYKEIYANDAIHTLSVKGLCNNSSYEIGKQIAFPLMQLNNEGENTDDWCYLFNLLIAYQKCSKDTLQILNYVVKESMKCKKNKILINQLNEKAYDFIRKNEMNLLTYQRFYPESEGQNVEIILKCNAAFTLLYNELQKLLTQTLEEGSEFTAMKYSKAVLSKEITDDFVEYPILKYCKIYLQLVDDEIINAIKKQNSCKDTDVCQIIQLLNWRNRFLKICSLPIFELTKNKIPILKEDIVPLLNVHSRWIQKHLILELAKITGKDLKKINNDLTTMNLNNQNDSQTMLKLSKKLRKTFGQPNLYENDTEQSLCLQRYEVYNSLTLDMDQPIHKQLNRINSNISPILDVSLVTDVPDPNTLKVIQENIFNIVGNADIKNVKLLPINLYVIQRIVYLIRSDLINIVNDINSANKKYTLTKNFVDLLVNLVNIAKEMKGFPPTLLSLLKIIQNINNGEINSNKLSSIPMKFIDELYKLLVRSPVQYPLPFLNYAGNETEEDNAMETVPLNTKRFSSNLPLMPFYVQKLTISSDQNSRHNFAYESVPLKDRAEYSMHLANIRDVLWKNIGVLDAAATLNLKSNIELETRKYEQLMYQLHCFVKDKSNKTNTEMYSFEESQLIKYFKDTVFVDMISIANSIYENLKSIVLENSDNSIKMKAKILITKLSVLTSFILLKVMAEISPIDHVEKHRLKIQYIEEDVKMFESLLSVYYVHGIVTGCVLENTNIEKSSEITIEKLKENKERLNKVHPYCSIIAELKEKTAKAVLKYASGNTFRPKEPSYGSFAKDCKHFTKSVLSQKTVTTISKNLIATCDNLYDCFHSNKNDKNIIQNAQTIIKETSSWLHSVNAFYKKIETIYSEVFPDLAKPLQASISQVVYSITSLSDIIKEMIVKIEQGSDLCEKLTELLQYPNKIPQNDKEIYLNRFVTSAFMQMIKRSVVSSEDDLFTADLECLETLKMNLSELNMRCVASEGVDRVTFDAILKTLTAIVDAWEKQRKDIEKKKIDDEALYVTKSKCEDEDEDAIAQEEIMEMFPSYSESDFAEFKPPTLEQRKVKLQTDDKKKSQYLITNEDVSLIYKWHSNFAHGMTSAEWLPSPRKLVANNVVSPLLMRYPIFSRLVNNSWEALDAEFEGVISPTLMVILSDIKEKIDGCESSSTKIDFYRSAWVSETKQCLPLLQRVKDATNNLLDQWPDFPTLKDIMIIVERIINFSITSPVSRFLTGLELLRDKIEEWNKNAHKANNMIDISLDVGQQIINWRKLEMSHWKECLNNLYNRKQAEAHKYWFYLYSVVNTYLFESQNDEAVTANRVISVLKEFMESSNLVEYEVRLNIVYVYHCHLIHLDPSPRRDELLSILWNTYNFYSQFSMQIANAIKEKRTPIEKKLRDFVKICTWDRDLSYWSVKDTVEKAHKALHKQTKEFENVLKESVVPYLVDNVSESTEHVGLWDRPKRATGPHAPSGGAYMIDHQNHIVTVRHIKKYLDQADQPCDIIPEGSLLSKIPALMNKAKSLCKDTMFNSGYPSLVQALDDFVTVIIETNTHLTSLEVDTTESKDKQKSQAKNIVQQKRKALADLFKYLSQIGLNYRTGLVILSAEDDLYDFTIPPVDLDAAMNYLKSRRSDATLSLLWSGCEKYFQRNIARHRLLAASLTSPHKDLGMQNIERCKGFSAQLMKLTIKQKKSVAKHSRQLCDLRRIASSLTAALEIEIPESNISTLKEKLTLLSDCYSNTSILLDQFCVLLQSCPEKTLKESCDPEFDSIVSDSAVTRCYKKSDEWNVLYKSIKSIITEVSKQKTVINKLLISTPKQIGRNIFELPILSQSHIDVANEAKNNLFSIIKKLNEIKDEYQFTLKALVYDEFVSQHPLLRSLNNLDMYLKEIINRLDKLDQSTDVSMEEDTTKLVTDTEDLVATMLLVIQSLYKKHLPIDKNDSESDVLNAIDKLIEDSEGNKDMLEDKHLKERLQENLLNDVKLLQLDALINKMYKLLTDYVQYIATVTHIGDVKIAVSRVVPILEQAILFIQYFVSQKVAVHRVSCKMLSVLLKIFSDLATKGFCKPSDLDMEDGEGAEGPGTSSGMGLGEGEGQKDVSERIENQDQLDDAQKPGEEKKEEDKDCKEEEKGINMTDDFESHLQDVEEKEGDDSEQEDNDDDADKQMGDTDKAAEKLDQQIWGSEDEDDVDEQEKDKDEKGQGESTGEKQLGAKEEEQGTDDGTEGEDKKKKKDINEMEEPEVDDDHIDPHHGKEQKLPEPEDFEMPDDMNVDGEEGEDKEEGETETENPFEIDVMKDVVENEEDDKKDGEEKDNKNGLEVSSDEDDDGDEGNKDDAQEKENADDQDKNDEEESSKQEDENQEGSQEDTSADVPQEIEEQNPELPENENKPEEEELPKNPDEINEEDNVEKKEHEANPQANPSSEDPSMAEKAENAEMDRGANDNVETNAEQAKDEDAAPFEQAQEQVGEDKQSTGRSELDKSDRGHRGEKQAARAEASQDKQKRRENKPGRTDDKRTLGEVNEQKQKRAHTLNVEEEDATEEGGDADNDADKEADAFQHVKQGKKDDLQAIDAATKEQAEQQPTLQQEDEDGEEMKDNEEVPMDVDDDDLQIEKSEEIKPEKMKNGQDKEQEKSGNKKEGGEETTGETGVEVEGETVLTADVPRGRETTYHTKLEDQVQPTEDITMEQYLSIREYLRMGPTRGAGAVEAWRGAWRDTAAAARALCERLRLVLEPTGRSRRAGDFRTGRAINMRRVIPYIASQFRKDRIWLRRTKPARRDYKIALALDDSSSMSDNRSKELAFESLALVSQALNLLESGDLAVISFGEKPNLLHPFSEQFSEHSGAKILDQLRFDQTKTKIAQLLDFCTVLFDEQNIRSDAINAKLLVIVSDGRGIFSEGETRVIQAVRRARQQGIFCVYIIIDNPDNKDSIMDIRRPVMDPVTNTLSGFVSYLDAFPFPFYLLLRDLAALPTVLGDALRQWFELAANVSS